MKHTIMQYSDGTYTVLLNGRQFCGMNFPTRKLAERRREYEQAITDAVEALKNDPEARRLAKDYPGSAPMLASLCEPLFPKWWGIGPPITAANRLAYAIRSANKGAKSN